MITARAFLTRGLLAGLIAGFASFGVAYIVGEPSVGAAISREMSAAETGTGPGSTAPAHGPSSEAAEGDTHSVREEAGTSVPRSLQSTLGLLSGVTIIGTVLGGVAGMVTALALGRFKGLAPRAAALGVAATGFVILHAVPFLIYPPNPPGVGNAETLGERTKLYFALVAISVLGGFLAAVATWRLQSMLGGWYAALVGIGGYVISMALVLSFMPKYNEVRADFPAQLLFQFRTASLLTPTGSSQSRV